MGERERGSHGKVRGRGRVVAIAMARRVGRARLPWQGPGLCTGGGGVRRSAELRKLMAHGRSTDHQSGC
jgi:hypothetical protein